jgi:hypothetical protein
MRHIKYFEEKASYDSYISSNNVVLPNISYTVDTNEVFYNPFIMDTSIYEWIDLGLPSGLKWASCNVGATKPEDFGLYFAWGETEGYTAEDVTNGKKTFNWSDYKWCNGSRDTLTKYNNTSTSGTIDNLTTLEQVDDAAYQSDNSCRMSTKADFEELTANTISTWETLNGVNGRRFTSTINNNSIFLPANGMCFNNMVMGADENGFYLSSSLGDNKSYECTRFTFTSK